MTLLKRYTLSKLVDAAISSYKAQQNPIIVFVYEINFTLFMNFSRRLVSNEEGNIERYLDDIV